MILILTGLAGFGKSYKFLVRRFEKLISYLDKIYEKSYHCFYMRKAGKKRSTSRKLTERTVRRLEGGLGESVRKVASELGF